VSFAAITLCVASQRVFIVVYFVIGLVRKLLDTPSYSMHDRDEKCIKILVGKRKVKHHLGDRGFDGRITLKLV
jgi:hypothetical protein